MRKTLFLLIKPASGGCNLRCKYCFYHDLSKIEQHSFGIMSESTMEMVVKNAYEYADGAVTFGFQGGEPTLRGLDFFRFFIEMTNKYNANHIPTQFTMQTNGMLIDDEWAQFLGENKFLVGLSLDGNRNLHDMHRIDTRGEGTYKRVLQTSRTLTAHHVDFNILCVVTKAVARHGAKIFNHFKTNGFKYLQFIPCLDNMGENPGLNAYSITPKDYGRFLIAVFDIWYHDMLNGKYTSVRLFDNLVQMLRGNPPESCDMQGSCSKGTVIEADGSMYPCDFYVMNEWKLGNVLEESFEELLAKPKADEFVKSSQNIADDCLACEYIAICRGGCRRHKEPITPNKPLINYFCVAYKMFYAHTLNKLNKIVMRF